MNEETRALNEEGRELWNQKAAFRDTLLLDQFLAVPTRDGRTDAAHTMNL